jgi:hypothetical protein
VTVRARLSAALAALLIAAACGGTATSPSPSAQPSPTSPATSAPATSAPATSAPATTLPTTPVAATPAVTGSPSPSASPVGAILGTDVLLYVDEFEDPASGWGTGELDTVTVAYGQTSLDVSVRGGEGDFVTTRRTLDASFPAVRFAALWEIGAGSDGIYGVHCQYDDFHVFGGAVGTDGSYMLYEREGDGVEEILQRYDASPLAGTGPGSQVMLMIECARNATGGVEVFFSANGELLLHQSASANPVGELMATGVWVRSEAAAPFEASITEAAAWVRPASAASATPAPAVNLIDHIPSEFLLSCSALDVSTNPGAVAGLACRPPSGGFVSYTLHESAATMNAEMDEAIEQNAAGAEEEHTCSDGQPGYGTWTIGGEPAGRYVCFVSAGYSFIYWTTDALNIFAVTNRPDEDMEALWEFWSGAGPNR